MHSSLQVDFRKGMSSEKQILKMTQAISQDYTKFYVVRSKKTKSSQRLATRIQPDSLGTHTVGGIAPVITL